MSPILTEKRGMSPGHKLALFVGRELANSGDISKGGTLIIFIPHSLINQNPYAFVGDDFEDNGAKIIIECRMKMDTTVFFEVKIGCITDFSTPMRDKSPVTDEKGDIRLNYRGEEVRRVSNLYVSASQAPIFLQHVFVRGYFTQRFLMTTSAKELGEMTIVDFFSKPSSVSLLSAWLPNI
jgi:hypothetical protein